MTVTLVQFVMGLPIVAFGVAYLVWALMRPRRANAIGLGMSLFTLQFCLPPLLLWTYFAGGLYGGGEVAIGWLSIYIYWGAALAVGRIWKTPLEPMEFPDGRDRGARGIFANLAAACYGVRTSTVILIWIIMWAVRLVIGLKYGMLLSGKFTADRIMGTPYPVWVAWQMFRSFQLGLVFLAVTKLVTRQPGTLAYLIIFLAELPLGFLRGRRSVFLIALVGGFAIITRRGRVRLRHALLATILAIVLWKIVFPFFVALRYKWRYEPDLTPMRMVEEAWWEVRTQTGHAGRRYHVDFYGHLNAIELTYRLASRQGEGVKTLRGQFLWRTMLNLVPRVIYPAKFRQEMNFDILMNQHYGMPGKDNPTNMPLLALADGGLLACALYGVIFALGVRVVELMLIPLIHRAPFGAVLVFSAFYEVSVFSQEYGVGGYVVSIRLALILFLLALFFSLFLRGGRIIVPRQEPGMELAGAE